MLKVKWDCEDVTIENDDDSITFNWDDFSGLQNLLGEAKRLSQTSMEGEINFEE